MSDVKNYFGSMVFNDQVMRERLPKDIYKALHKTVERGTPLDISMANVIATVMKDWAIEKGATHYTHWFQPMTGVTAEKHDSFISDIPGGQVIMEFSGKELIKGEPDASSFPSGGIRATFEARGYTAWDPTSYAFVKDGSLCIPTAFCSYGGEALDKKTPLLRSMQVLSKQALRILKIFKKDDVRRVKITVGAEQEYFLVDRELYNKRKDLMYAGRTLYGAKPPKGQEMDDHYFGSIKTRVSAYMKELDEELWKLGILSKTKHNEAAPAQHELAPIFTTTNIATDHNQLTMEMMQKVAERHGLVCLLHEKPFEGVNGSGKHNNWSLSTDTGVNIFEPGDSPEDNDQFLLFLSAVIKAVDDYQELLRVSVATPSNDHRLGANEAPPAIVSMFIGDDLEAIVKSIIDGTHYEKKEDYTMEVGVKVLPKFRKDTTDRNRTSPLAFTGNKFEFRMPGSKASIASPNIYMNTIVAEVLSNFATQLENGETTVSELIKKTLTDHQRIIFNGNNYSDEWVEEAEKRGLANLKTTADALPVLITKKSIDLFTKHGIFTENELHARYEIILENYVKTINIEAATMIDIAKRDILPAVGKYIKDVADTLYVKKQLGAGINCDVETDLVNKLSQINSSFYENIKSLEAKLSKASENEDILKSAIYCKDEILTGMSELRKDADELETMVSEEYWPMPVYGDLLFGI